MKQQFMNKLRNMGGVDQLLLAFLALLSMVLPFWHDGKSRRTALEQRVQQERSTLEWMRQATRDLPKDESTSAERTTAQPSLFARINQIGRQAGITTAIRQLEQFKEEDREVARLTLENLTFLQFMNFMGMILADPMEITSLNIRRGQEAGIISARLKLAHVR